MRKHSLHAVCIATPPAICAASVSAGDEVSGWAGKTVVLTARPTARFMSYSRTKISFGMFGVAAAAVQGKEIIEHNGIENPAPQPAKALFDAAQAHYGLAAAALAPLSIESADALIIAPASIARSA